MTISVSALSFHSVALCVHAFAVNYHFTYMTPMEVKLRGYEFGGSLIYLTHVTNLTHIFYYCIVVFNHFTQSKTIRKFGDFLFASLVIPLGLLVFAMYWGLHCVGNDLVFPVRYGFPFPPWLNFCLHTSVAITPLMDIVVSKHYYPNRWLSIISLIAVLLCYLMVLLLVNYKTGQWVYGILGKCDIIQRTLLIGGCGVAGIIFCLFGEMCNKIVVEKSHKLKPKTK